MKKIVSTTEIIMKIWAKISSLLASGIIVYGIYATIQVFTLPITGLSTQMKFMISLLPYFVILSAIFYSPLFYYGWVKNPNSKKWRWYAKVIAITYTISVLIGFISNFEIWNPPLIPIVLALIAPLYYYGWKKQF